MSHVRTQIRDAAAAALASVGEVSKSRVYPLDSADLPILLVYTNDEEITGSGVNYYQRTLDLVVEIRARGEFFDDDLDQLLAQVETALNRSTLGGLTKPLTPVTLGVASEQGSAAIGTYRLTYRAIYFTDYNAPTVAI